MKVIFLSNYFNHHQKPFSDEMYNIIGDDYKFISTNEMPIQRKKMGYQEYKDIPYLINYNNNVIENQELIDNCDILIFGTASERLLLKRKKENKIIFRCYERPLKNGLELLKYIPRYIKWHIINHSKNIYMLSCSAYTALDYSKFNLFKDKVYKWGYFTEKNIYNDINELIKNKNKNSILWVGRLIDYKHPEVSIEIARRLKNDNIEFEMNIIGIGELYDKIQNQIIKYNLDKNVHLLGAMAPTKVRKYMEINQILLFTSNKEEGWGAVLNEAMNSGCAVVASHAIGSVPFLIDDGENGLIYEDGNIDELYNKVKHMLNNRNALKRIEIEAYKTIINLWNPKIAATRLIHLTRNIIEKKGFILFDDGPCSRAEIIKDNWYKRRK